MDPNTSPSPLFFITAMIKLIPAQKSTISTPNEVITSFGFTTVVSTETAISAYPTKFGFTVISVSESKIRASTNRRKLIPTTICFFFISGVISVAASISELLGTVSS